MGNITFGKTNWDKKINTGGGTNDFLDAREDKTYRVRIVSEGPYEFAVHWAVAENGSKRKVRCAGPGCILCKEGEKAQARYMLEVLYMPDEDDETKKEPKLYEFSPSVYNQIQTHAKSKHWGAPHKYDLLIKKDSKAGPARMYTVTPLPKSPLSEEDKATVVEFKDRTAKLIETVTSASTNEEICEKLGRPVPDEESKWDAEPTPEGSGEGGEAEDDNWELDF